MKKLFSIFLFLFLTTNSIASPCIKSIVQQYINADIVAKVKIIKSFSGSIEDYDKPCYVEVGISEIYKGITKSNFIKINYFCNSFDELYMPLNSEWIVFAYKNNNQYTTHSCSGSKQIDRIFDENLYPNYNDQYQRNITETISLLKDLKKCKVNISNKLHLDNSSGYYNFLKNQNELEFKNKYAFYKVIFNSDFTIKKIKTIKGFSRKFDNDLKHEIIENSDWYEVVKSFKKIPQNTEWLIIIKQNDKSNFQNIKFTELRHN